MTLPTDDEYLEQLRERLQDDEWVALEEQMADSLDADAIAHEMIAESAFTSGLFNDLVKSLKESRNPSQYFRGKYINLLETLHSLLSSLTGSS
jgi:hypothetical protein